MLTWTAHGGKYSYKYSYYRCNKAYHYGSDACPQKAIRVEHVEPLVWDFVSDLLADPERIRVGIEQLIEQETRNGDLTDETEVWTEKIAECDRLRSTYQDQQAAGLMTMEELGSKLMDLEDMRKAAKRELVALDTHRHRVEELAKHRDTLLRSMMGLLLEALDSCASEEKNRLYRMLRLEVVPCGEGYKVSGAFVILNLLPVLRRLLAASERRSLAGVLRWPTVSGTSPLRGVRNANGLREGLRVRRVPRQRLSSMARGLLYDMRGWGRSSCAL